MTQLYEVECALRIMVAASSPAEAERLTYSQLHTILNNEEYNFACYVVEGPLSKIHKNWTGTIPYGDNPEEYVCDLFTEVEK